MDSYINKKIVQNISLAKSILDNFVGHIGKLSQADIDICQKLLDSPDTRQFLHPEFVEHIEAVVEINRNKLIKIAEQNLEILKKNG